jgi:hypothetical protein
MFKSSYFRHLSVLCTNNVQLIIILFDFHKITGQQYPVDRSFGGFGITIFDNRTLAADCRLLVRPSVADDGRVEGRVNC